MNGKNRNNMDRKEAIETIRRCMPRVGDSQCDFETALRELIPELGESEDERIRKAALEGIEHLERNLGWDAIGDIDILDVKRYLEKQKEPTKEELYAEAGTTEEEYVANTMKKVRTMQEKLKEQKPVGWSEDLEEEIAGMYQALFGTDIINRKEMIYLETFHNIARHFAEWGAKNAK